MWGLGSALCHHLARRDLGADTVPEPGRGGVGGGMKEAQWHLFCMPSEARQDESGSQQFPALRQDCSSRSVAVPLPWAGSAVGGEAGCRAGGSPAANSGSACSRVPRLDIFLK